SDVSLPIFNEDASLSICTGTVEMGQGSETVLAQIAGKELGVPLGKIQVLGVDTDVVPYDLTTSSSRSTFHMGKAVQLAAQDIMRQLKQTVVKEYGIPEEQVSFADGKIRLPETALDYAEVMFKRFGMQGGTLVGEGQVKTSVKDEYGEKSTSAFWFLAAGAAEVEVDSETGKIRLIKYVTAVDVGKAINPLGCRQQLSGAAITGIGQAMFEEIAYDNGQLINPNLVDYVLPSLGDMPSVIDPICVEVPNRNGPFGAKGIGESALIPVAPAIANAIFDAVGVRIKDLPIEAEKRRDCNRAFREYFEKAQAAADREKGIALYRDGLGLCPDDEVAHYELGKLLADRARYAEAEAEFQSALKINPDFVDAKKQL